MKVYIQQRRPQGPRSRARFEKVYNECRLKGSLRPSPFAEVKRCPRRFTPAGSLDFAHCDGRGLYRIWQEPNPFGKTGLVRNICR